MVLNFIYLEKFYSESVNPLNGKPGGVSRGGGRVQRFIRRIASGTESFGSFSCPQN